MQKYKPKIRGHQISISEKMLSYVDSSFSPDVVWALVPAVASTLKNAVPTLKPIKKPRLLCQLKTLNQITSYEGLKLFKLKNPFHFNLSLSTLQRCCFSNWLLLS